MTTPFLLAMVVFLYRFLINPLKRYINFTPDILFAIGLISYLILSGTVQLYYGNTSLDILLHDTYLVVPHYFPFYFALTSFAIFALIYHWFPTLSKHQMNHTLGCMHFWITFLGISILLLPMRYSQLVGVPRRYYDYADSATGDAFHGHNTFASMTIFLLLFAQLLFVVNIFYSSLLRNR